MATERRQPRSHFSDLQLPRLSPWWKGKPVLLWFVLLLQLNSLSLQLLCLCLFLPCLAGEWLHVTVVTAVKHLSAGWCTPRREYMQGGFWLVLFIQTTRQWLVDVLQNYSSYRCQTVFGPFSEEKAIVQELFGVYVMWVTTVDCLSAIRFVSGFNLHSQNISNSVKDLTCGGRRFYHNSNHFLWKHLQRTLALMTE